jgi:hypothetical protein
MRPERSADIRRGQAHDDAGVPGEGVLVLRLWTGPDDELVGRVQWSTGAEAYDASVRGQVSVIMREIGVFVRRVCSEIR